MELGCGARGYVQGREKVPTSMAYDVDVARLQVDGSGDGRHEGVS